MRIKFPIFAPVLCAIFFAGCKATPEKVCRHLKILGAENADQCVPYFEEIQSKTPQYWGNISSCILSAQDASTLHTCHAIVDLVRAQSLCDEVMERIPEAYDRSLSQCLDVQHELQQRGHLTWDVYERCIADATDVAAVRACEAP